MEWKSITMNYSNLKIAISMIIIFESINYLIEKTLGIYLSTTPMFTKIGIMLIVIVVHEFIHFITDIIFVQNKGKLHFGFVNKKLAFYINVDGLYKKNRFMISVIAPCLLSIVLSAICIYYKCMDKIIWQFIFYNIVASTVDVLNLIDLLFKYRDISYYKLEEFILFGSKLNKLNLKNK